MDARAWTHVLYGIAALGVLWFALRPRGTPGRISTGTDETESASFPTMAKVKHPPITTNTLSFIKREEALKLTPYRDGAGWSVGYGHYLGTQKPSYTSISKAQADRWLIEDAANAANTVHRYVRVPLTSGQFNALVSFIYNIGEPAFTRSTLLRRLNEKNYTAASEQFRRWVYQGQTVLTALVNRRGREKTLFLA